MPLFYSYSIYTAGSAVRRHQVPKAYTSADLQRIESELVVTRVRRISTRTFDLTLWRNAQTIGGQLSDKSGSAAGLLINQSVGDGALLICFGWFRKTIKVNGKLAFDRTDVNGRHIVWGWLEVGKVWKVVVPPPEDLRFLGDHPHVKFSEAQGPRNTVYVSSQSGLKAGAFSTESESVVLTKEGGGRSVWLLP